MSTTPWVIPSQFHMSEDLSQAVPATTAPVEAVPPVRAIDSDDPALLRNKIELAKADREKAVAEKQSYKKQVEDLIRERDAYKQQDQSRKQADLLANGQAEVLVEQLRGTVGEKEQRILELEQMLQDKDVAFQQSQIKATAMSAFQQGGVHTPEDLFNLEKDKLRLKDGSVVALVGGVETPLQQHVESLRSPGSGRDYFFSGSGARGMSAAGSSSSASGGKSWGSMGLVERIQMEEQNPQLAAQLKAAG